MEKAALSPVENLNSFHRKMNGFWKEFSGETTFIEPIEKSWGSLIDRCESKDSYIIHAKLPGFDAKDIDISISENFMTIEGKKIKRVRKNDHLLCSEKNYGTFHRLFRLPKCVYRKAAEATFDKGILKITLPKIKEGDTTYGRSNNFGRQKDSNC
jgi:HSP20 family protein